MAKKRSRADQLLAQLGMLRPGSLSPADKALLVTALESRSSVVVARAAKLASDADLYCLSSHLVAAFRYFTLEPYKTDVACLATTAIVSALSELQVVADEVYLQAIRHRQPIYMPEKAEDVAVELRNAAAMALVKLSHPRAREEVVQLLVDEEVGARIGAVRALAVDGSHSAALLLRYKALLGEGLELMDECLGALLKIDTDALPFVASFLSHPDPKLASVAALALGESRNPAALPYLEDAWSAQVDEEFRPPVLLAIATLRSDEALQFLIGLLRRDTTIALQALSALSVFAAHKEARDRIEHALVPHQDRRIREAFEAWFPPLDERER